MTRKKPIKFVFDEMVQPYIYRSTLHHNGKGCGWNHQMDFRFVFFRFLHEHRGWCYRFIAAFQAVAGVTGAKSSDSMGEGQGTPWMSRQLIAGPLLMAVAATQGANCTSGAILGVSMLLKACSSVPPHGARDSKPSDH